MTACPLCRFTLEVGQLIAFKLLGAELEVPVLHFTQLVGLALGEDPERLGLGRHVTPARKVLEYIKR